MRVVVWLGFVAIWFAIPASAQAGAIDDSLRVYAVTILQHPEQSWPGYGIYLGKGLVITAAHVVGEASRTKPSVRIAGQDLPAKVIKEGAFDQVDLTLLAVNEQELPISLQMRRMPLCRNLLFVGEEVIVVIPESTARSRIMSPRRLPANVRARFNTVISDVATTGNSGSGVFDAQRKCLLGIMSRKIQVWKKTASAEKKELRDLAKYFVAAPTIRSFMPAEFHF